MCLSKIVSMESWITIEASTIKIQSAQLFLSVLIQFLASYNRDTRITICLRPDCRRACLNMKYPVQFARISRPESIDQHSFLELVIVQMNLGTFTPPFWFVMDITLHICCSSCSFIKILHHGMLPDIHQEDPD